MRTVSTREAREKFSDLLGLVHYSGEAVMVERRGRPFAVIISPDEYARLLQEREERFAVLDRIRERNREVPLDQTERDVAREVAAFREESEGYSCDESRP